MIFPDRIDPQKRAKFSVERDQLRRQASSANEADMAAGQQLSQYRLHTGIELGRIYPPMGNGQDAPPIALINLPPQALAALSYRDIARAFGLDARLVRVPGEPEIAPTAKNVAEERERDNLGSADSAHERHKFQAKRAELALIRDLVKAAQVAVKARAAADDLNERTKGRRAVLDRLEAFAKGFNDFGLPIHRSAQQ